MSKPKARTKRKAKRKPINEVIDGYPPFGVLHTDSSELLRLRQAIDDHLGWRNAEERESGNYVTRVQQVGTMLSFMRTQWGEGP